MKQLIVKNKILCVALLIIVVATILVLVKGFNVETLYKQNYRIRIDT